ncbi:hypothetical protein [Caproiciproducens sp.]
MKFAKRFTRREAIPGGVILCCLVLMAAVFFFPGGRPEPENAQYSGKNGAWAHSDRRFLNREISIGQKHGIAL